MKQTITRDQLNELSKNGKKNLLKWWKEKMKHNLFPGEWFENELLSIGQLIEFLDEDNKLYTDEYGNVVLPSYRRDEDHPDYHKGDWLCDDLWEVVKEVLEKDV